MTPLSLGAALKRGALVTAANWPVVLIDFALESFYKVTLTIPVLGGVLMVTALVGSDVDTVVGEGLRATADLVLGSLSTAPVALVSFLTALAIVGLGGETIMFVVKAGTLSVIVRGERSAGEFPSGGSRGDALRRAYAFSLARVYDGVRQFGRRAAMLALWLGVSYVTIGAGFVLLVGYGWSMTSASNWLPAWPLAVVLATTAGVVTITVINLVYDLLRVIIVTDDCGIRTAASRLLRFVTEDARHVLGIFSVIGGVLLLATVGSLVGAAGIALTAWIPFLGFVVVPIQIVAWLLRGLSFQFVALAALCAYQTQYRRYSEGRWRVLP